MDDITTATRHCPMGRCTWSGRLAAGCASAAACSLPEARWAAASVLPDGTGVALLALLALAGGAVVVLAAALTVLAADLAGVGR